MKLKRRLVLTTSHKSKEIKARMAWKLKLIQHPSLVIYFFFIGTLLLELDTTYTTTQTGQ
jgi:hypothetical protein